MKKHIIFIITCIACLQSSCSQENIKELSKEGVAFLENYKFTKAERQFSTIINRTQDKEELKKAYMYRGYAFNGQGKFDKAIQDFDKIIELEPKNLEAYLNKGKTYLYKSEADPAIQNFEKVISYAPDAKEAKVAYYYLGNIHSSRFESKKAIKYLDKLIKLAPTDAEAYFLRASTKNQAFDFEGAVADYDLAIQYKPKYQEAYAGRGVAKIKLVPATEKNVNATCLESPCADLLKAKKMGDASLEEVLILYCKECK